MFARTGVLSRTKAGTVVRLVSNMRSGLSVSRNAVTSRKEVVICAACNCPPRAWHTEAFALALAPNLVSLWNDTSSRSVPRTRTRPEEALSLLQNW